jgi:hypothetical protein
MVRLAGDGLRSVGVEPLPSSKSVCSILPLARRWRAGDILSGSTPARGSLLKSAADQQVQPPNDCQGAYYLRIAPRLQDSVLSVTMPGGGTRLGEEVRDGPHGDNRCGSNRCGVAPTAAPLRARAAALWCSGPYNALGRAGWPHPLWRGLCLAPSPRCAGPWVVRI